MGAVKVERYTTTTGECPFDQRIAGMRDAKAVARIAAAVVKMGSGLFGDWKAVGEGVQETRLKYGPGYRIYYAMDGNTLVILLACGDKRTQTQDIEAAHGYWNDYKARK